MTTRHGGSFAPPMTDEAFAAGKLLVAALPADSQEKDALDQLINLYEVWYNLPESQEPASPHASGRGQIVPLSKDLQTALWDHIPWADVLQSWSALFDRFHPESQKVLRNFAFHLLWYANELNNDREPITLDKVAD